MPVTFHRLSESEFLKRNDKLMFVAETVPNTNNHRFGFGVKVI